ncbi:MAG: hypothetical protein JO133_09310 [Burkholderiaceae bacterium]|nr:hypothetical protein [Burkholderiaceae bacterium]
MERQSKAIIDRVIHAAIGGDVQCAKLVLDRVCPPLRPVDLPVQLLGADGDAWARVNTVMTAALSGTITPDACDGVAGRLGAWCEGN